MEPTYGDYTFGFIWRYSNTFERFDVVLYKRRQDLTNISRIVGLPGEKVEIKEGALFIDGNRLDMSRYWINQPKAFGRFTLTLAPDQYALLSDNGHDGEATRLVTAGMIVGTFVYLPLGQ